MESLSLTVNHDHSLAVLGSRAGIKAHICSNGLWCRGILAPAVTRRVFWSLKASTITVFFAILSPFIHAILYFGQNMLLRSKFLLEFAAVLKDPDNLLVSWQNFLHASLLACLFVDCTLLLCFFLKWFAYIESRESFKLHVAWLCTSVEGVDCWPIHKS